MRSCRNTPSSLVTPDTDTRPTKGDFLAGTNSAGRASGRASGELVAGVGRGDPLARLTGESGTGMARLWRARRVRLDLSAVVSVIAGPFLSLGEVLEQVLADFDTDSSATFRLALP